MTLIDTHAHIYVDAFSEDLDGVVERARENDVKHICMPNIDSSTIKAMYEVESKYPGYCHAMMGLHPCSVNDTVKEELDRVERELASRDFIAIGEIGLDYHWDTSHVEQQKMAYRKQLDWAREMGLPVVIHSRKSWEDTLGIVEEMQDGRLSGVFHCFGESRDMLRRIADMGFYVGLGGVVTFKKVTLRDELEHSDLKHIVLETDSPYLAPVPYRGKRNESSYLKEVVNILSKSLDLCPERISEQSSDNAYELFRGLKIKNKVSDFEKKF